MSDNPALVNRIYSFILIACALVGFLLRYLAEGDLQYTALIPGAFGIILLPMGKGIKNENPIIAHIAVLLVLVVAIMMAKMSVGALTAEVLVLRKVVLFAVMFLASVWALTQYVKGFIAKKKAKKLEN